MEQTIMEAAPSSAICDGSNEHVGKKRKSSVINAECNSLPDDSNLQKSKRRKGGRRKKSISNVGSNCNTEDISSQGDLSPALANDTCAQASAEVSNQQRKENDESGSAHPVGSSDICCSVEDGKSGTSSQSLKTEVTPSILCNEIKDHKAKKKRRLRKTEKSISNDGSNCEPEDVCSQKESHSNPVDNGNNCPSSEGREPDMLNKSCMVEIAPSILYDQDMELKAKERKKAKRRNKSEKRNSSILNVDNNCNPDQADAEVSPMQIMEHNAKERKKSKKKNNSMSNADSNSNPDRADVEVSQMQSMELNAKERKKSMKIKSSISNADSNSNPDQADAEVSQVQSTELNAKVRKKSKKIKSSISNADSNSNPDQADAEVSQVQSTELNAKERKKSKKRDSSISNADNISNPDQADAEVSPMQMMEHNAKERKKSKKRSSSVSNADSNSNPDQADAEVPQMQNMELNAKESKKSKKRNSSILNANNNSNPDQADAEVSQIQSMELNAKERKKSKKINSSISNADSNSIPDQEEAEAPQMQSMELNAKERKKSKKRNSSVINTVSNSNPDQADSEVSHMQSMELHTKERKKSKKRNSSISNADSNSNPDQADAEVSQIQSVELNAKERKKSKKRNSSISNADSNSNLDPTDAEVSQLQKKETKKAGGLGEPDIASQSCDIETVPSTICNQSKEHKAKKKRRKKSREIINDSILNAQSKCDPDAISSKEISSVSSEQRDVILPALVVKAAERSNRKLLILDLNGILADICPSSTPGYVPNARIRGKSVYKRPFCDDFLQFCLETFDVGVWSSRMRNNVDSVLDCIMGDRRKRLLFCWDASHCTKTGRSTLENRDKPLVLKELKKLWHKSVPGLPWNKLDYNQSNTLLIDDSPYKALRNPPYTGIFPHPYVHTNIKDNSLGPDGELRLYLTRLATAETVSKFVAENPIGQSPITKSHRFWAFYSKIINNGASVRCARGGGHKRPIIQC